MFTNIITKCAAAMGRRGGVLAAALIVAGMVLGWGMSTTMVKSATATVLPFGAWSEADTPKDPLEKTKGALVGTYVVTGTDPDGNPYMGPSTLDISLAPSGALELNWDNGRVVGVGQFSDNVLSVALLVRGRTAVSIMKVNPDGSLSGTWLRRTDRGSRGTETWRRS
jgi:hypothetical protein